MAWWNMMQKASQSLLCCWCGKIFASLFTVSNSLPQAWMSLLLKIRVQKGKSTITGNNLKVSAIFIQCLMHFWCDRDTLQTQNPDYVGREGEDPRRWRSACFAGHRKRPGRDFWWPTPDEVHSCELSEVSIMRPTLDITGDYLKSSVTART